MRFIIILKKMCTNRPTRYDICQMGKISKVVFDYRSSWIHGAYSLACRGSCHLAAVAATEVRIHPEVRLADGSQPHRDQLVEVFRSVCWRSKNPDDESYLGCVPAQQETEVDKSFHWVDQPEGDPVGREGEEACLQE